MAGTIPGQVVLDGVRKQENRRSPEEQASMQHSSMASASVSTSRFLPCLIPCPWLPLVMGWDLRIVSAHKLFLLQVVLILVFHDSNRNLTKKGGPYGVIKMYPE